MLQLILRLAPPWHDAVTAALLGDAFGVPHEFKPAHAIPRAADLAMVMPGSYAKTYSSVAYGTWSDDGSQMMALLDTLVAGGGKLDGMRFGENLLGWLRQARYQPGGVVFDCGAQTLDALTQFERNEYFGAEETRCGNGSLMRVMPVAALPDTFMTSRADAIRIAMRQSAITHPQALARVCCALYVELMWLAKDGYGKDGLQALVPVASELLRERGLLSEFDRSALDTIEAYGSKNPPSGSGYVVSSLWAALWAVDGASSLSETLRKAVSLGEDTDTIACIAGALAALVFGWDDTAREWRRQMNFFA